MATKRTPVKRAAQQRHITPELRAKIERVVELNAAHLDAIRGNDEAFYYDGRHAELVELIPPVHRPLGIRPWEDADAKLAERDRYY
jgi:hypothetical protein